MNMYVYETLVLKQGQASHVLCQKYTNQERELILCLKKALNIHLGNTAALIRRFYLIIHFLRENDFAFLLLLMSCYYYFLIKYFAKNHFWNALKKIHRVTPEAAHINCDM